LDEEEKYSEINNGRHFSFTRVKYRRETAPPRFEATTMMCRTLLLPFRRDSAAVAAAAVVVVVSF
jgi:hypothetical protein